MSSTVRRRTGCTISLLGLYFLLVPPGFAGELSEIRHSVRETGEDDPPPRDSRPHKRHRDRRDGCDDDHPFSEALGELLLAGLTAPFWVPHVFLEDDLADHFAIAPRPYLDVPFARRPDDPPPALFGRIQMQGFTDLGDLSAFHGQALIETPWRFGVDAAASRWNERTPRGDDQLWLGDFNVVYRFAESEDIHFRSGIGLNWMSDAAGSDTGFNFTYGVDYYPRRPWVLSSTFDVGTLGDAGVFHNQSTVGLVWDRLEVFTGYEVYRIGGGRLHGWINGVRLRF